MRKTLFIILYFIIVTSLFTACEQSERPMTVSEILNLGDRYLLVLNYEQALVQFLRVIEIEPMNPRGYLGAAEAYVGLGLPDRAMRILEQGLREIPNNLQLQSMLDELQTSGRGSAAGSPSAQGRGAEADTQPNHDELESSGYTLGDEITVRATLDVRTPENETWMAYLETLEEQHGSGFAFMTHGIIFIEPIVLPNGMIVSEATLTSQNEAALRFFDEAIIQLEGGWLPNVSMSGNIYTFTGKLVERDNPDEFIPFEFEDGVWVTYYPWGAFVFELTAEVE